MKILLAQDSLYYPAHAGRDKSHRLLLEALAVTVVTNRRPSQTLDAPWYY